MNVSSVVNHFPTANKGFITTLGSTISAGAVTVPLTSVSGLTNGTIFVGIIEPGQANEQEFTGTVDTAGVQITGVKWTDGTNVDHTAGVTIVDYVSATGQNMQTKGLLVEHNQDGTHGTMTADNLTVDGTLTQTGVATFDTHIDVNDSSTAIRDSSDNELVKFSKTSSAVNELTIANAATANGPEIQATGTDTNIDIELIPKGTGVLKVGGNTIEHGAWTTWTPTITAQTGTITTKSGTGKYAVYGKTCVFRVSITITTNGTGAVYIICTLPLTASSSDKSCASGRANIVSGKMLQGKLGSTTVMHVYDYANAYPAASGEVLELHGFYEIA